MDTLLVQYSKFLPQFGAKIFLPANRRKFRFSFRFEYRSPIGHGDQNQPGHRFLSSGLHHIHIHVAYFGGPLQPETISALSGRVSLRGTKHSFLEQPAQICLRLPSSHGSRTVPGSGSLLWIHSLRHPDDHLPI